MKAEKPTAKCSPMHLPYIRFFCPFCGHSMVAAARLANQTVNFGCTQCSGQVATFNDGLAMREIDARRGPTVKPTTPSDEGGQESGEDKG